MLIIDRPINCGAHYRWRHRRYWRKETVVFGRKHNNIDRSVAPNFIWIGKEKVFSRIQASIQWDEERQMWNILVLGKTQTYVDGELLMSEQKRYLPWGQKTIIRIKNYKVHFCPLKRDFCPFITH